jgi:hemerythrin-like domain-containing protein
MTIHERHETPRPHEHPVETLEGEHRVIQTVLDAMELEANSVQAGQPLRKPFWLGVSEFLEHFADGRHHAKEEDLLFPVLAERGIAEEGGPIGCMKHEHVEGRSLRQQIRAAATDGDGSSLVEASRQFVFLLREHIDKEEAVLFQLARRILSAEKTAALEEAFFRAEHEDGGQDERARYLALARKLCDDAAVQHGHLGVD